MSQAIETDTISAPRRILLTKSGPAFAPTALGLPLAADAELIALGRELDAVWAIQEELESWPLASEADIEHAHDGALAIVRRIKGLRATTPAGLKIKARAIAWCYEERPLAIAPSAPNDEALLKGLVNDVLAIGEA